MIDGLVAHLEEHLGAIAGGWQTAPDGTPMPFQVVHYVPEDVGEDTLVFSTLGLSDYELEAHGSAHSFRLELVMLTPTSLRDGPAPGILLEVGRLIVERCTFPPIGTLFTSIAPLRDVSAMDTLLVARPLPFAPEIAAFRATEAGVNVAWLLPVYEAEADYVRGNGWRAFEGLIFEAAAFDPVDIARPSLVADPAGPG